MGLIKRKKPNNAVGLKGRSGRKTDIEIVKKYINNDLAAQIANRELLRINKKGSANLGELKVVVMPVVLKGMTDKVRIEDLDGKSIFAEQTALLRKLSDKQDDNKSSEGIS